MIEYPRCPACGRDELPPPLLYEASRFSRGQVLGLSRCPSCRVYFTRPRLADHNKSTKEATFDNVRAKYEGLARGAHHKSANFQLYLRLAEERLKRRAVEGPYSVLDIGAHCGFFLKLARERGWTVAGVEPSRAHARFAREINEIREIEEGYLEDDSLPGRRFHLITLLDVLEHIPNPVDILRRAREKLHPGGLVLAKVPNVEFYLFWKRTVSRLGRVGILPFYPTYDDEPPPGERDTLRSGFFDLFEHVVHYEESTAKAIFQRAGFSDVELHPAPPSNPRGHPLNAPRSLAYALARLAGAFGWKPRCVTHGLVMLASREDREGRAPS